MSRMSKKVGPYEIKGSLGKGGMGEVYLGHHPLLNRDVAIKRLVVPENQEHYEERFRREGRALAALHHQGIIEVYDLFVWRGDSYMVLELVDGFDAAELLKKAAFFPPDVASLITLRVAEALEHAHLHGVIHRDIKPANVMVSRQGEVRLMDFGVARDESLEGVTATGMMVGTPIYLAPEVVRGEAADERSDVYATGALLYQLLSGRRMFEHANGDNLYHLIAQGRFPPVHKVQPDIPRALRKILKKALQTKPQKRYGNASDLRTALERFLITHGAWKNGTERLALYLHHAGHISESEALTVVDAEALVVSEAFTLRPEGRLRKVAWVALGMVVAFLAAGFLGGHFDGLIK